MNESNDADRLRPKPSSWTLKGSRTSTAAQLTWGAAWFVGLRWGVRGIGLLSTIVLARLLIPADFGLVAVATSYIAILEGFSELSLNFALIREARADRSEYDTAFTLGVIRGILVAALVLASAFFVPRLMGDDRLVEVIALLALQPLLTGFANPKFVEFERNIDFSREAMLQIGTKILGAIATIGGAFYFRSYWALVGGLIVLAVSRVFWSYLLAPYQPRFSLAAFRQLMAFSGWLAGGEMLTTLSTRFDNILVALIVDVNAAGLYNVGTEISRLPYAEIIHPLTRVLFPGFNRFVHDPEKLRANVREACQAVAIVGIAAGAGFALIADDFVRLVLGGHWQQIIPVVQILSPFLSLEALVAVAAPLAMAMGDTRGLFNRALAMSVIRPPIFIFGVLQFNYLGGVLGAVVSGSIFILLSLRMIARMLQISTVQLLLPTLRPALAAIVTVLSVLALEYRLDFPDTQWGLLFGLAIKVCVGAVAYCLVVSLAWWLAGKPKGIEARTLAFVMRRLRKAQASLKG